jgi:subtilisin family serine protease
VHAKQQLLSDGLFLFNAPANYGTTHVINMLQALPGVKSIQPDFIYHIENAPNDPQFNSQWDMSGNGTTFDIKAPAAWDISTGNSNVVVGVIDTGVDYNHPDLSANIWTNPGEIPGNGIDDDKNGFTDDVHGWDFANNDNDPMDDNSHGTHVSGTIGAKGNNSIGVVGVNWNVKIMALKFLGANGMGTTAAGVSCVNYATMMHNRGVNIRVTNNSWGGGGFDATLYSAINNAGNAGMLFVAAAGNNGSNMDAGGEAVKSYPAAYDLNNIISVANITSSGSLAFDSNYGVTSVDLGAPGSAIISTTPNNTYSSFSGTSMASPHVAGAVAMLLGLSPTASYQSLKAAILNSVDPTASLSSTTVTGGRLNLFKAVSTFAKLPSLDPASDSGTSNSDEITNDSTPTFFGNAAANAQVTLYANGTQVGSGTANGSGDYSVTVSTLTDGFYDITASWTGSSGQTGPIGITIDTVAQIPAAPDLDSTSDSGGNNADNITKNTSLKLLASSEPGTLTLYRNGVSVASTTVNPGGGATFTNVATGPDGVYNFTASVVDIAGNVSSAGAPLAVTIDTSVAPPTTPVLDPTKDSGAKGDGITKFAQPKFNGTAEDGTVRIFSDGSQIASAGISGGTYGITSVSVLSNGTHTITAQDTDIAGNVSTLSGPFQITIDTIPPTIDQVNSGFYYIAGPQSVKLIFSENVGASVQNTDLQLFDADTFEPIPSSSISVNYNSGTNTATFTWSTLPGGVLPDGNYGAAIAATSITDPAANATSDFEADFFFLMSDANHDRAVDLTDFTFLASNFNQSGKNFAQGDFNYDDTVDLTDFTLLAANFNRTLAPPPPPAGVASTAAAVPAAQPQSAFSGVTIDSDQTVDSLSTIIEI